MLARAPCGKLQHRFVQPVPANRKLRGVDTDCKPAGAGLDVIARQGALATGVELSASVEGKGMRRDDDTLAQARQDIMRNLGSVHSVQDPWMDRLRS